MNKFVVITTINKPQENLNIFKKLNWEVLLIGDKKTPNIKSRDYFDYISLAEQKKLDFKFATNAPLNHYARKNIGYLLAMRYGAEILYDTDDDNLPIKKRWGQIGFQLNNYDCVSGPSFVNIYKYFTSKKIWPRGFPLREIGKEIHADIKNKKIKVGVWQGLADNDPDVDAIYRLTVGRSIIFKRRKPIVLSSGSYCPFNSQNTFWNMDLAPLLYLPSTVSFRFTDILRGYIAQAIMWNHGFHLGFTESTVVQERNPHDLMKDFISEYPMYTETKSVVNLLGETKLGVSLLTDLKTVYINLYNEGVVKQNELSLLDNWIQDIKSINSK